MRTKLVRKKLSLSKVTVANMDNASMAELKGGYNPTDRPPSVNWCPTELSHLWFTYEICS